LAVLIQARDVPAARRVEAWLHVVADVLGPLDVRIDLCSPLRGRIEAAPLGPLGVGRVGTPTPHSIFRTPGLIRQDDRALYRVLLPVSGTILLDQEGRRTRLGRGDLAIYDFSRPYELHYDSTVELAVFSLPHEMLSVPADAVARLAGVPISGSSGTAALAAPLLRRVAADAETYRPASAARLSTVVLDLLATTVAERTSYGAALTPETRERVLVRRVQAFIEEHLADLDLGPATVAAAHHLSLRQLHRLFESQDTTVAAWIRLRRLERCRRDLVDPANLEQCVGDIAARWGLPDAAHFSRIFRQAYGMPPGEYRRACLMPGR
jgi:AraC-like DNA-binding protein